MIACSSCSREIPQDSRVCPYCAEAVEVEPTVPTVTAPAKAAGRVEAAGPSDAIDQARFTPGTMLTERYRSSRCWLWNEGKRVKFGGVTYHPRAWRKLLRSNGLKPISTELGVGHEVWMWTTSVRAM
jgi:hypothetical protein